MSTASQLNFQTITELPQENSLEENGYNFASSETIILTPNSLFTNAWALPNQTKVPRSPRKQTSVIQNKIEDIKQVWLGTVLEVDNDEFTAKIDDYTSPESPSEIVTLLTEEIEERDLTLLEEGATFFWHIGYKSGPKYPKERFSKISFRRLPSWTAQELSKANNKAKEYADFFLTNSEQSTSI